MLQKRFSVIVKLKERTLLSIKLIGSHLLLLPFLLLISLIAHEEAYLLLPSIQLLLLITFLAGYWEFFGLKFRYVYSFIIQVLIIVLLVHKMNMAAHSQYNLFFVIVSGVAEAGLIFALVKIFIVIFHTESELIEIGFPLNNGRYLVTDGGNSKISRLMNYHYYSKIHMRNRTNNSMKFATDIVRIGSSKRFLPAGNNDYSIFGDKVYSPIEGIVIKVVNDIDDNLPFSGNYPYNTGNTVVIRQNDLYFLIGHLKKGSIVVSTGDNVKENDLLAECGNSGYSERPHVHMQLIKSPTDDYWRGEGMGITFKNKPLYKNRMVML